MSRLVILVSKVKRERAAAKASLNRAFEYVVVDPKPGDLPMSRVKAG